MHSTDSRLLSVDEERKEVLTNMEAIEREFTDLKDTLFKNSIQWLKQDCVLIRSGQHERFVQGAESLEAERREKIWRIEQLKKLRMQNIERMFEAEQQQANDEFQVSQSGPSNERVRS